MTNDTTAVRRPTRLSVLVGVITLVLVAGVGAALALLQPASWSAQSSFVVLPRPGLSTADSASYYETLSRGQVAATFAEIAQNSTARQDAVAGLGLSSSDASEVSAVVSVVPNTSVILITVTAPRAAVAESVADGMSVGVRQDLATVARPYALSAVASARGAAYRASAAPGTVLVVAVVVGLVAAVLVQQVVYQLALVYRRRRAARPVVSRAAHEDPTPSAPGMDASTADMTPTDTPVLAGRP